MAIRDLLSRYTPKSIKRVIRRRRENNEIKRLYSLEKEDCDIRNLIKIDKNSLSDIFNSMEANQVWESVHSKIQRFNLPDGTGGVNHGDRRAIFYLVHYFNPENVLEIGTHIGASTVHISSALYHSRISKENKAKLITVDVRDVNSGLEKPWKQYGATYSPEAMIRNLGHDRFVEFKAERSLKYMENTDDKFDFIFLDGSHDASNVYREIPGALKLLNQDGVILLHDYFPDNKPLWNQGNLESGVYLAVEKFIEEGVQFKVLPVGKLPWETKLGSKITSLALMSG